MKKIINPTPPSPDAVFFDQLPEYPIIGAIHRANPHSGKCFLVMNKFRGKDCYTTMCVNGFEIGNGYGTDVTDKAKEARMFRGKLHDIFAHPSLEFFLFDTPQELFKWLSK